MDGVFSLILCIVIGGTTSAVWGFIINPRLENRTRKAVFVKPVDRLEKMETERKTSKVLAKTH